MCYKSNGYEVFADGFLSCPDTGKRARNGERLEGGELASSFGKEETSTDQLMGVGAGDGVASFMALG